MDQPLTCHIYPPGDQSLEEMHKTAFAEALSWKEEEGASKYVNGAGDRVVSVSVYAHLDLLPALTMIDFSHQERNSSTVQSDYDPCTRNHELFLQTVLEHLGSLELMLAVFLSLYVQYFLRSCMTYGL